MTSNKIFYFQILLTIKFYFSIRINKHIKKNHSILNPALLWPYFLKVSLSFVWLLATPWSIQSMEFCRPEYWSGSCFFSRGSSQPRNRTLVFSIAGRIFTSGATRKTFILLISKQLWRIKGSDIPLAVSFS